MKYLWLISQDTNNNYDTYDSAVVCAETETAAQETHPNGHGAKPSSDYWLTSSVWVPIERVKVQRVGTADESTDIGVVCASFNAG